MSISMPRLKAKFPTLTGVTMYVDDQEVVRRAYVLTLKGIRVQVCAIESEHESHAAKLEPIEELKKIKLDDDPEHKTRVRTTMSPELKSELVTFLRANKDVFA